MTRLSIPGKKKATAVTAYFFIADDIRLEQGGKVSAIGLYADRVIVAQMRPDQQEPSKEAPLIMEGFVFLVSLSGLEGKHRVKLDYSDDAMVDNAKFDPVDSQFNFPDPALSMNFVGRIRPFITTAFGSKRISLEVDGEVSEFTFEIRRGKLPEDAGANQPAAKSSARRDKKTRQSAAHRA